MFVDELEISAYAGKGGDGVVRWRRERFRPKGGPAGGNGGKGGDVYMRAVRDLSLLSKYTGSNEFRAQNGENGRKNSQYGKDGEDVCIDVPVGATVTDLSRDRIYHFDTVDEKKVILYGGQGGLGNEYFKSSTNRAPEEWTPGKKGEKGTFHVELSLVVDVGLIGLPNAGKSTLMNALTNTQSKIGAYPFTTVEPHLGDLYGYTLADIPGLIEGASEGKGLGHKFLRHVARTKMLLHLVSLENDDVLTIYKTIRNELTKFDLELPKKEEWIILTKADLVDSTKISESLSDLSSVEAPIFIISATKGEGVKPLSDALTKHLATEQ